MKLRKFSVGNTVFIKDYDGTEIPVAELVTIEKQPRTIGWLYPDVNCNEFNINGYADFIRHKSYLRGSEQFSFKGILDGKVEVPTGDRHNWDEPTWKALHDAHTANQLHNWTVVTTLKGCATLACLERQNWWKHNALYNRLLGVGDITHIMYVEQELPVDKKRNPHDGYLSDGRCAKKWYSSKMDIFILEVLKYLGYPGYMDLTEADEKS